MIDRSVDMTACRTSVVARSEPESIPALSSSGKPGSTMGDSPRPRRSTFSGLISTAVTGKPDLLMHADVTAPTYPRSEEHTSELQSLMRISYAVFCLKKKKEK